MTIQTGLAVYAVMWWLVLFMVLPFGISRINPDEVEAGHDPGAPANPKLLKKMLITTVISSVCWGIYFLIYTSGWVTFRPN